MPVLTRPNTPTRYSGDVIVRVKGHPVPEPDAPIVPPPFPKWLVPFVQEWVGELESPSPRVERLVRSRPPVQVLQLEQAAVSSPLPPLHSLTSYYRIWMRDRPSQAAPLAAALAAHPQVDRAWAELTASPPAVRFAAPHQPYLGRAPRGVGVTEVAARPGVDGEGVPLYVIESGWCRGHVLLASANLDAPLWGDDAGAVTPGTEDTLAWANHGTSTLGVLVARRGGAIVGMVPSATTRLASCFDASTGSREHVADAIVACLGEAPPGAVLLLEVHRGEGAPTEVEDPDFDAIRLATARGITVIEPAGNGGHDLDAWTSPRPLDPSRPGFEDSGAVMVGALTGDPPTTVPRWSSRGRRVDVWAHGTGVATTGAPYGTVVATVGELDHATRDDYRGTSAAAAIVTGVVTALSGVEAHLPAGPAHPLDLRARLRAVSRLRRRAPRPPNLGALVAKPSGRHHPLPGALPLPAPLRMPHSHPAPALAVGHPQTSEGNTNVRGTDDPQGPTTGWVYLGHPSGSNVYCLAGGTPTASAVEWIEEWEHYDLDATLGFSSTTPFKTFWFHYGSDGARNPPAGKVAKATGTVKFTYAAPPATTPTPPGVGWTQGHFTIHVHQAGTTTLAGAMRRFVHTDRRQIREHWFLNASYRFPSATTKVEVKFDESPPGVTFATWFDGWRGNGTAPPWYVSIAYTLTYVP